MVCVEFPLPSTNAGSVAGQLGGRRQVEVRPPSRCWSDRSPCCSGGTRCRRPACRPRPRPRGSRATRGFRPGLPTEAPRRVERRRRSLVQVRSGDAGAAARAVARRAGHVGEVDRAVDVPRRVDDGLGGVAVVAVAVAAGGERGSGRVGSAGRRPVAAAAGGRPGAPVDGVRAHAVLEVAVAVGVGAGAPRVGRAPDGGPVPVAASVPKATLGWPLAWSGFVGMAAL